MSFAYELSGWVGAVIVLGVYWLVTTRGTSVLYHVLNVVGAVGLLVNALHHRALPSSAVNVVWIVIAVMGISGRGAGPMVLPATEGAAALRLHRWTDRRVVALALLAVSAGFGQYGAVAALGDVARGFGHATVAAGAAGSIAEQTGLSGTKLGLGLAVLRLASLGGLPLAALADRYGRRRMALSTAALGLACTALAAASPGYWWFVGLFVLGRPLLSATNALVQVMGAEETSSADRAKAISFIGAGYGVGAGVTAILHGVLGATLGFRGLFALAVVPWALLAILRRWVVEPDRFLRASVEAEHRLPVFGAVERPYRRRVATMAAIGFGTAFVTGPANGFLFVYAENVLGMSGAAVAVMVVAAGATGLVGLIAGRWLADNVGRRATASLSLVVLIGCAVLAYSGGRAALMVGYLAGVGAGGVHTPGLGSLAAELFPTSVRASVAGWLLAAGVLGAAAGVVLFGAIADVGSRFGSAATVTFPPVLVAAALLWTVPETRGREPEEVAGR